MLWVAITGGIACGKSVFASMLRQRGYMVVDTDQLAHDVTAPGSPFLNKLALHFGSWVLNEKGELDRPQLFDKLFESSSFKAELESLMHPPIYKEVGRWKKKLVKEKYLLGFCEVPLLYEKELEKDFDFVVVLSSPLFLRETRLKTRLKKREGGSLSSLSESALSKKDSKGQKKQEEQNGQRNKKGQGDQEDQGGQREQEEKFREVLSAGVPLAVQRQRADYAIENDGTLQNLEEETDLFLKTLKKWKKLAF